MVAKRKTYNILVVPSIMYATETFTLKAEMLKKFEKFCYEVDDKQIPEQ